MSMRAFGFRVYVSGSAWEADAIFCGTARGFLAITHVYFLYPSRSKTDITAKKLCCLSDQDWWILPSCYCEVKVTQGLTLKTTSYHLIHLLPIKKFSICAREATPISFRGWDCKNAFTIILGNIPDWTQTFHERVHAVGMFLDLQPCSVQGSTFRSLMPDNVPWLRVYHTGCLFLPICMRQTCLRDTGKPCVHLSRQIDRDCFPSDGARGSSYRKLEPKEGKSRRQAGESL